MIECSQLTNGTEEYHKNFITSFGNWHISMEMSDCLLCEWRHRHNQDVSEHCWLGYRKAGHYNVWLIEIYQVLVVKNHGLRIYPELGNTSDYKFTDESFDTNALQTLAEAVQNRFGQVTNITHPGGPKVLLPSNEHTIAFPSIFWRDRNEGICKVHYTTTGCSHNG